MRACLILILAAACAFGLRPLSARWANAADALAAPPGSALIIVNAAGALAAAQDLAKEQDLARELSRLGFSVSLDPNLRQEPMRRAIDRFAGSIKPGSAALFFFSGYGIEAKGSTYLIPAGADIWTEPDVRAQGISVGSILAAMEKAGASVKIVILDASRRNPFERRFRSLSAGLGPIDLPPQTLLLSSAEPGKVASDDARDGGVFVGELLKELRSPDLRGDELFRRAGLGVSRATGGERVPLVQSTLSGTYLLGLSAGAPASAEPEMKAERFGPPSGAAPGSAFKDCATCPDLIIAPAGQFEMGSAEFDTEQPVHSVIIAKPFAIGRAEVTFAQWDACVAEGGCGGWRPGDPGGARGELPVSEVSWDDAHNYLDWLSRKSGHAYRLPSEAEWEYAARGGTATRFWWGDDPGVGHANCRGCGGPGRPTPAGTYPANGFGLVDVAGNVAEWVEDCWSDSYVGAPRDGGVAERGPCKQRVVRGGSFDAGTRYVRSASRFLYDAGQRYYTNGFRVVRDLP